MNGFLIIPAAILLGALLAIGTAVGVVQSQQSAGSSPVSTDVVNYGSNG